MDLFATQVAPRFRDRVGTAPTLAPATTSR
jgi:hypothetical protein